MRRLGSGGFCSYLGNGSEADMDDQRVARRVSAANQTSSACGGVLRFSAAVSNGCRDWRGVSRGHSSRKTSRSAERTVKLPDGLTRRRTEPMTGNRLRKSSTTTNPPKEE